jgi:hypothetical protein
VKEYIEEAKPLFAVGEYWDSCEYSPTDNRLSFNQGKRFVIASILISDYYARMMQFLAKVLLRSIPLLTNMHITAITNYSMQLKF